MPLAAGENITSQKAYASWLRSDILERHTADPAKWGGFSKTVPIAKQIIASGKRYCPHYLGAGLA